MSIIYGYHRYYACLHSCRVHVRGQLQMMRGTHTHHDCRSGLTNSPFFRIKICTGFHGQGIWQHKICVRNAFFHKESAKTITAVSDVRNRSPYGMLVLQMFVEHFHGNTRTVLCCLGNVAQNTKYIAQLIYSIIAGIL